EQPEEHARDDWPGAAWIGIWRGDDRRGSAWRPRPSGKGCTCDRRPLRHRPGDNPCSFERGAAVVVGARDVEKARAKLAKSGNAELIPLNLASPRSMDSFADAFLKSN